MLSKILCMKAPASHLLERFNQTLSSPFTSQTADEFQISFNKIAMQLNQQL